MLKDLVGMSELLDVEDFTTLLVRLLINLLFASVIIWRYSSLYRNDTYRFTYYVFNVITFSLCLLLRKVPIELGFALGMFAVFGILRYRTEAIGIRDLTYLFSVIGIAILNAVANKKVSFAELLLVNVVIVGLILFLESKPQEKRLTQYEVLLDNIALLSGSEDELRAALTERLGMEVREVSVRRVDLLRDTAILDVSCALAPKVSG